MRRQKPSLVIFVALFFSFFSCSAWSASPESFRTPEYLAGKGLDAIHAAEAYALGYSGKGVTVGVLDSNAFPEHPEFAAKFPYPVEKFTNPRAGDSHGIHTAGTIAASRDGQGMHGVAWGADLVSVIGIDGDAQLPFSADLNVKAMRAFGNYPQVSIISNSWGYGDHLAQYPWFLSFQQERMEDMANVMAPMAESRDILFVFAAGNEARSSPSTPAALPSLLMGTTVINKTIAPHDFTELSSAQKRALSLNMISVMAFDPDVSRTDNLNFMANFTNLADGATRYSLLAPGVNIYSAISSDGQPDYKSMSGTSMATPHVAGVAALVKEAFPYMGGKQMADVLLSTATSLADLQGLPPFLFLDDSQWSFSIIAPQNINSSVLNGLDEEVHKLYESYAARRLSPPSLDEFIADLKTALDGANGITPEQYAGLFGMGIVNAYRAVLGPGHFDASRLDNADLRQYGGVDYAMYSVDTMGHDGVWGNDIGQVKATDPADVYTGQLAGLDVGLRKTGAGRLWLTGQNRYLGPTVIDGGAVSLGRSGVVPRASLAGDVLVEAQGVFSGNGRVYGDLSFAGLLSPGLDTVPGSELRVEGNVVGGGELRLHLWSGGQANLLTAGGAVDIRGTSVSIAPMDGGASVPRGSSYTVINAGSLTGSPANSPVSALQGSTLWHSFTLRATDRQLFAMHDRGGALPQAKALAEGFLAGTALVNQGADLVAGQGVAGASSAAGAIMGGKSPDLYGVAAFGSVSGGSVRYHTGSHLDLDGFSLLTGLSLGRDVKPGRLVLGAFFEYGQGDYDTYNSFSNAASARGDGDTYYTGGGILGRLDFLDTGPGHFYAEASGRAGKVHNEYDCDDLRDALNRKASYDVSSPYYGLHFGAGYVWEPAEAFSLDAYGKWFWTHQEGDGTTLSTGETVRFSPVDSHRLRFGARFAYAVNAHVKPYVGAAYEHEFDGRTKATTNGMDIDAPKLRGDTGIGELGLNLTPSGSLPFSLDLNVQGSTGKREGVTGGLRLSFMF